MLMDLTHVDIAWFDYIPVAWIIIVSLDGVDVEFLVIFGLVDV